jgi:hypothetical protein
MRFLVGTFESAGMTSDVADGLSRLGHPATTAMTNVFASFAHCRYHFDLSRDVRAVDWTRLARTLERNAPPPRIGPRSTPFERLHWILAEHDVFVFVHTSLRPDRQGRTSNRGAGREYPLLKRLGKKIVSMFVGPEVRHWSAYDQELRRLGGPGVSLGRMERNWQRVPLERQLLNLRRAELYADVIVSQPNQSGLALRPYTHFFAPINLSTVRAEIPRRQVPVVLHAPSDSNTKGTAEVMRALDALEREGVRFERRLVQGRPNPEVLHEIAGADVVIDQLHLPLHGRLGVEAMASGCALATCDRADWEPIPAERPIWHIDVANLKAQLRRLLSDRALRVELARAGRRYVERHHGHVEVARRIVGALERPVLDHHPRFFAHHYRLPRGVRIAQELRRLTAQVVRRHGAPDGVTLDDLRERGLA